tara:strand:+ start:1899 stop:2714 length:816 start_codon:yes stop_codon:yes gene_type:complete
MNFQEAGPVAVNPQFEGYSKMGAQIGDRARASVAAGGSSTVDISMDAVSFMKGLLEELPGDIQQNLLDQHGDEAGVQKAVAKTAENIEDAIETEDPAKVSAAALKALDVPDTEEGRLDVANTFGFDTSNIAALDDKIMEVLMAGRATDFQQAVLVGLQNYKSTAMARASGSSSGGGFLDTEQGKAATELYIERIKNNEDPAKVEAMMNEQLGNNIGTRVRVAIAGGSGGVEPTIPLEDRRGLVEDALKQQPENRDVILKKAQADGVNIEGL